MPLVKQGRVTRVWQRVTCVEIDGERFGVPKHVRLDVNEGDEVLAQVKVVPTGMFIDQLIVNNSEGLDEDGE